MGIVCGSGSLACVADWQLEVGNQVMLVGFPSLSLCAKGPEGGF